MAAPFENKLAEIIHHKREEVEKLLHRLEKLKVAALERNEVRSLYNALDQGSDFLGLIAEVKKASPSAGVIAADFDPVATAVTYDQAGASAISCLTDEKYFQGQLSYLSQIRQKVEIPVLRKDFIVHEVQIYESVVAGADAILLIVAALEEAELHHLLELAEGLQLDVLVEVHDLAEMETALDAGSRIIGINNRNLKTFEVDLATTERLSEEVPDDVMLVSESGIKTPDDASQVFQCGSNAILVGEALMRSGDVAKQVQALMGVADQSSSN